MRGKDGKLGFSEKDRKRIWKNHMEEIMKKGSYWNHMTEASMAEELIDKITRKEMATVVKPGRAIGPSKVCAKLCQRWLDRRRLLDEGQTSMLVPIFKEKGDLRNWKMHRGVKLLQRTMKVVEKVLERRIGELVYIDAIRLGFMLGRGRIDGLSVVRTMQEKCKDKKRSCICVLWILRRHLKKFQER